MSEAKVREYRLTDDPADEPLEELLPGRLWLHAQRNPDRAAMREKYRGIWKPITWSGYRDNVAATARMLVELGVGRGDHVAILSENCPEWLYADLGAQTVGARAVGVYQTNPAEDVAYILTHSKSRLIFCEDQEQVDKVVEVADQTPSVEHVIVFDPRGTRGYDDPRLMSWDEFIGRGRELLEGGAAGWMREVMNDLDPKEPSMIVYTSGTTGDPKGAMISSYNVIDAGCGMAPMLGITEEDTVLSYLPLCHVAEKIFTVFLPLITGATVHFGESIATVQEDLKEVSPTIFLGVPRIWEKMHASVTLKMKDSTWLKRKLFNYWTVRGQELAEKRRNGGLNALEKAKWQVGDKLVFRALQERLGMRDCRHPVTGAAPISADLLRWFHGIGVPVLEGYGQTECAGVSHLNPPGNVKIGSVGQPLPLVECRIAEDGEIQVRGPMVFVGYLNQDDATQDTITEDGWLKTGDIGKEDESRHLFITGRKKEIIITAGGKNLSPEKIENALKMSPYIKEAVAIGDRRKFVSALIQIDFDAVGDWATRRKITYTSFDDLAAKEEVRALIEDEVNEANERLARVESVREFRLFDKELHQDDGELTATQKVRRSTITEMYEELIESIYL